MKKIIAVVSLMTLVVFNSCSENKGEHANKEVATQQDDNAKKDRVVIYDFHSEHRCVTCIAIEKAVKDVIHKHFEKQFEEGIIEFELLNCESEENKDLVDKYGAFGTTLIVSMVKDGKELKSDDLTNWAFEKVDTDAFETELVDELNDALDQLKH